MGGVVMKKDKKYKLMKPRGRLVPPNKVHKSKKVYNRKKNKEEVSFANLC